jgi:cellulose synthase/poly-beta-1,6-N-acetylglucosamine synthase-like glycosyltransferase
VAVAFWAALATIGYSYVGYPILVLLRAWLRPRPHLSAPIKPRVSVVIAARDEASVLGRKLESLLACDYPADRIQVIVASDGSTDATVTVAGRYSTRGVRVLDLSGDGKARALNAAVRECDGEILVFTDANSDLAPNAIKNLMRPFADPDVGGVAGNQVYRRPGESTSSGAGERAYWDVDRWVKLAESRAGSAISATGALYAIRRELFLPIPDGVTDDFITSVRVVAQGRRLVFEPTAIAYEDVAVSSGLEYSRKVRVMTRGLHGVVLMRELLDPRRHGFYSVQLMSHKVLRRLTAVPLLILLITAPFAWRRRPVYRIASLGQGMFYLFGVLGILFEKRRIGRLSIFALPAFFCMVNAASLVAVRNILGGRRVDRWIPARGSPREVEERS